MSEVVLLEETTTETKNGYWILVSEENILTYDLPGRCGIDRNVLLRFMDEGHKKSMIYYVWIENQEGSNGATTTPEEGAQ